jgi:hypothetical protein
MLGLTLLLLVSTAGGPATDAPSAPSPAPKSKHMEDTAPPPPSPLRRLMQAQLDMPARRDGSGGISGPEADAVMARYLASIGKPLSTGQLNYAQGGHP